MSINEYRHVILDVIQSTDTMTLKRWDRVLSLQKISKRSPKP